MPTSPANLGRRLPGERGQERAFPSERGGAAQARAERGAREFGGEAPPALLEFSKHGQPIGRDPRAATLADDRGDQDGRQVHARVERGDAPPGGDRGNQLQPAQPPPTRAGCSEVRLSMAQRCIAVLDVVEKRAVDVCDLADGERDRTEPVVVKEGAEAGREGQCILEQVASNHGGRAGDRVREEQPA